jgi:hypothetical protein
VISVRVSLQNRRQLEVVFLEFPQQARRLGAGIDQHGLA